MRCLLSFQRRSCLALSLVLFLLLPIIALHASTPTWKRFGALRQARHSFAAYPLGNGRAIVIGGYTNAQGVLSGTLLAACEIIDVNQRTITIGASMNEAHAEFASTQLPDGSIVVASGMTTGGKLTTGVEVYNPRTQQWRKAGDLLIGRRQLSACMLNADELLVVGGRLANLNSIAAVEIFNLRTGQSRRVTDFPYPINSGVSILAASGRALTFGGRSGGGDSYRTAAMYEYDNASNQWRVYGNMVAAVQAVNVLSLSDGRLVASGGTGRESFTPFIGNKSVSISDESSFSAIASMQIDRVWHSSVEWNKDSILTIGGLNNSNAPTSTVDWINITNRQSMVAPTMPIEHSHGQALNLPATDAQGNAQPRVLMISGFAAGYRETAFIEILDRTSDSISTNPNAPRITDFSPKQAVAGARVSIRGRGFTGANAVAFGGVAAAAFTVQSDSVILATLGIGASGTVRVSTSLGSAFVDGFVFMIPPVITAFAPTRANSGETISISGTGFIGTTSVTIGGVAAEIFSVSSDSRITAMLGKGIQSGTIVVQTSGGEAQRGGFIVNIPPVIRTVQDTVVTLGDTLRITGRNFVGTTAVRFGTTTNSVQAISFRVVSDSLIIAVVGSGASGGVLVSSPAGTALWSGIRYIDQVSTIGQFGYGMYQPALDSKGNIYISQEMRGVWKIEPNGKATMILRTPQRLAGGIVVDKNDNVFIVDKTTDGVVGTRIVKLTPNGVLSVIAESPLFQSIYGLVMDKDGILYAVSHTNHSIVKITQDGVVTFLYAGDPLHKPVGLSFDGNGDLLITNYEGASIVRYSMCSGQADIVYDGGVIKLPNGILATQSGNVYIADHFGGAILKMTPQGTFEEFIGQNAPSPRNVAMMRPTGLALAQNGTLYAVDYQNGRVYVIPAIGEVPIDRERMGSPLRLTSFTPTTGTVGQVVNIRGVGFACGISGVAFGGTPASTFRLVSDSLIIATVGHGASGEVSITNESGSARLAQFTFLGTTSGSTTNSPGTTAPNIVSFSPSSGETGTQINIVGAGFLGATSVRFGSTIASIRATSFRILSDSLIVAVLGSGASGAVIVTTPFGTAMAQGFYYKETPTLLAELGYGLYHPIFDSKGNIFIVQENIGLQRITPEGVMSLYYRSPIGTCFPGLTIDNNDNLYLADSNGRRIVRISPDKNVTVMSNSTLLQGIYGLDIDKDGTLYASSYDNNTVLSITASGSTNVIYSGGLLNRPVHLRLDKDGNIIVPNDVNGGAVVRIHPCNGTATVVYQGNQLVRSNSILPTADGTTYIGDYLGNKVIALSPGGQVETWLAPNASLPRNFAIDQPLGLNVRADGTVYVVEYRTGKIWRIPQTDSRPVNKASISFTPQILAFTPTTGTVGQVLSIRGTRFSCGVSRLTVGGMPVQEYTIVSDSLLIATISTGATGAVSITTPLGIASRERFIFLSPTTPTLVVTTPTVTLTPPSIFTFTPTQASTGTLISIIGRGFTSATSVQFGSATNATPAASFLVRSDSLIIATLGVGATGNVTVISATGIATRSGFVYIAPAVIISTTPTVIVPPRTDSTGTSTPSAPVLPTITSIAPSCVAGSNLLTITGTGFTGRPEVRFGRLASATNTARMLLSPSVGVSSTTQLIVVVPSGLVAFSGLASGSQEFGISVSTTIGTATRSGLQYIEARPVINAFSPSSATRGDKLYIVGQGFTCASDVRVGGEIPQSYQVVSDTLVIATLGQTASGTVRITTPAGVAERGGFIYSVFPMSLLPTITSFTPTAARVGQTLTIIGTNFSGTNANGSPFTTTALSLGGVSVPFTVVSPTQITVRLPDDFFTIGTDVRLSTPGGSVSAQGFTFIPEPVITSFTPERASTGTVVLISGRNFTGATTVQFGDTANISGAPAQSFTVLSDTLISAVVGDGASGSVRVTTPTGTATRAGFTFVIPPPFIASFTPTLFVASTTITITGRNFVGNGYTTQLVLVGNNAATIVSVTPTTLVVRSPAMISSTSLSVITPGGTATACCLTLPQTMMPMLPQPPRILGFSPASSGVGGTITIRGENFIGTTDVRFGGVAAASFRVISGTEIQAIVGAGATGELSVRTPVGLATFNGFTFILPPQPIITSFSPSTGAAGDTVRVRGQYLQTVSAFTVMGDPNITVNATFTTSGDTLVTAVLGTGQSFSLGTINLRTLGGTARATGFTFIAAPVITSFSPVIAGTGDAVVINGAGFDNVQSVAFGIPPNLVQAASYVVNSPSRITASLSTGATGSVVVVTRGGNASRSGFTFAPVPTITRFTPDSARAGETVRIVGSGFISQAAVGSLSFGGVRAASFTVVSDSVITATLAQTGATGSISLTTPGGTAQRSGFVFLAPLPTITSFTPQQASVGDIVTINGTNLNGATSVSFGGRAAASFLVSSPTQIVARVSNGTSGTITIQTPGGRATAPNFVFIPAPPVVTSFSPDSAAASQTITLRGRDFSGITVVRFSVGGTALAAQSFSVANDSTITARVPALGTSRVMATISVQSPNGTGSREGLRFVPAPTISAFSPASATAGTTVVITGTNLSAATAVRFGGTNAHSFLVQSDTQITAVVGSGASGAVSVMTYGGTASRDGFVFQAEQIVIPAPTITSFIPQEAAANATVTITGTNFSGNGLSGITGVLFGGVPAQTYAVQSPTIITAVVGTGASGSITVSSARGNATLAGFRFIPAPVITDFTPKSAGRGAMVSITGRNFGGATSVSFGGTAVQFAVSGDTLIRATLQIGSTGAISVTTPGGTATAAGFTFTSSLFAGAPKEHGATLTDVRVQMAAQGSMRVYPNPTSDLLMIEAAPECVSMPLRITLRNALGVVVMTLEAQSTDGLFRKELNVAHLAPGAYSVETLCGGERLVARFVRF